MMVMNNDDDDHNNNDNHNHNHKLMLQSRVSTQTLYKRKKAISVDSDIFQQQNLQMQFISGMHSELYT